MIIAAINSLYIVYTCLSIPKTSIGPWGRDLGLQMGRWHSVYGHVVSITARTSTFPGTNER